MPYSPGASSDKSNLGFLGAEFQYKLCKFFIEEKNFFIKLSSIINQNMFTDAYLRTFVGTLKDYYEKWHMVPSYDMMEIELNARGIDEIDREAMRATVKRIRSASDEGYEAIKECAYRFFKQQSMVKIFHEGLRLTANGDLNHFDELIELMKQAQEVGDEDDLGTHPLDGLEETLSDDYRTTIPTGIGKIDETLEGGLGKSELGVIIGPSSFGKALPMDELVLTESGYKEMRDIKVGDKVIGMYGLPVNVVGVFPQGIRPIYRVTFSDGSSCRCDEEHLWTVNCLRNKKPGGKENYMTLPLSKLMKRKLKFKTGIGESYQFKIPMTPNGVELTKKELKVNPYLYGISLGWKDFSSKTTIATGLIRLQTKFADIIIQYLEHFANFKFIVDKKYAIKTNIYFGTDFREAIGSYYPEGFKHDDIFIPYEYLNSTLEDRWNLLRGIMDMDGHLKSDGRPVFKTRNERFAMDIRQLVLSLGGLVKMSKNNNDEFEIIMYFCDTRLNVFNIPDKQEKVKYGRWTRRCRYIEKIEYVGEEEAQCIKVDSEDGLFATRDVILTHNTSLTTAISAYAATAKAPSNENKGFKVLQIIFEDREKQIKRKYIANISGIEAKDLSKEEYIGQVNKSLTDFEEREMFNKNVVIKRYPSGEKTVNDIIRLIKRLMNSGFRPDLVILDYFECLRMEKARDSSDDRWAKEGYTMRKLESMAGDLDIAVWITTQGNRDSMNAPVVTMDKAGGSFLKIQIAHIILSIARTMEDIEKCIATISILKNRAGKAGKTFYGVEFNNGTCRISTDHVDEYERAIAFAKETERQKVEMDQRSLAQQAFNYNRKKNGQNLLY